MRKTKAQQGFTLLEVMIALTVFAIISILAWQILDGAMSTTTATNQRADELNQLQRTYNLLERDFFQLQARAPRREPEKAFIFSEEGLELTTLSGISGRLQLERIGWHLRDNQLWREVWPALDAPADREPEEVPILAGVKTAEWRFYQQGWKKVWHDAAHLPDGVELALTMENGETWRWVFMTPGDMEMPASTPSAAEQSAQPQEAQNGNVPPSDAQASTPAAASASATIGGQP